MHHRAYPTRIFIIVFCSFKSWQMLTQHILIKLSNLYPLLIEISLLVLGYKKVRRLLVAIFVGKALDNTWAFRKKVYFQFLALDYILRKISG